MNKTGILIILSIFICFLLFMTGCRAEEENGKETSRLVQPEKWWSVHPRPVYENLEKAGTFQAWFDVYRLAEGTYAVYEPNQFEEAISYLVEGRERAALVDTGTGIGNIREVVEDLTELPVVVVLTHEHYDHAAAAWRFDDIIHYNNEEALKVLARGRDNASLQKYITEEYLWKPLPEDFDPESWTIPPITPTRLVEDGEHIDLGGRELEVIYTPGHSPGQMCLLDESKRILFSGDHFFPGPLYAHAPDVNMADYIASNKKLTERLDEFDYICSGHNDPWVESKVLTRVSRAFDAIFQGGGEYSQDNGLRRYRFEGFDVLIREEQILSVTSGYPEVDANMVFFYYKNLERAKQFYQDVLGLEKVVDYGFAAIYRTSPSAYVGLVDEKEGMHDSNQPKTVTLAFVTDQVDAWYEYLKSRGISIKGPVKDASRHATRGFVAFDPEGYFLEFESFLDDPENDRLHEYLEGNESLFPSPESPSRPASLGLKANVIWLYYQNLSRAQSFYEQKLGCRLLVDQGFAKVYSCSDTGVIGLVDGSEGLHRFTEEKAVTVSFISRKIDDWYIRLETEDQPMIEDIMDQMEIPVRLFATSDPGGYYLEFDRFLFKESNRKILSYLEPENKTKGIKE